MTIEPKQDSFIIHCDAPKCSEYLEEKSHEFEDVIRLLKFKGWKTYKQKSGSRLVKCPACQEG